MPGKTNKKRQLFWRLISWVFGGFILLMLVFMILFQIYEDDIAKKVLLSANNMQKGELLFKDISFAPFVHFPNMSIDLNEVEYFEKKDVYRASDSVPIIRLNHLYLAIDVIDLFNGNVNISKVSLSDGIVRLITYPDSTLNLANAIETASDSTQLDNDSDNVEASDFELDLNEIYLHNIQVEYIFSPNNNESAYNIKSLAASFSYWPESIKCSLSTNINVIESRISNGFILKDKIVELETSLSFDRETKRLIVDPSKFSNGQTNFSTTGYIDFAEDGFLNLEVKADDKNFSMLDWFLTVKGIENIREGSFYLHGNIKGKFREGFPEIDVQFGINDVVIQIPKTKKQITNLNMLGVFQSGNKSDFSNAQLTVKDINATLPDGKLEGKFAFTNFVSPEVDLDIYLKSDVTGFEQIFKLGTIDSIEGILEVKTKLKGKYESSTNNFVEKSGKSIIKFDSLSFVIPNANSISNIYGRVEQESDTTYFKDLSLEIGNSDFNINGNLANVLYATVNTEKKIDGNLHIKSNTYDFPDFFRYDTITAEAFPYQIKDINLFVNASTSAEKLKNFINTPEILFQIDHLEAEIDGFLPPVLIESGQFILGDNDSSLNLDFSDFNIEIANSKLQADVIYNSPQTDPNWLKVDLIAENLNPKSTFRYWIDDTIPEFMDGSLDGKMKLDLVISNDSIQFDLLDFNADKLHYVNAKDTFNLDNFRMNTEYIDYDLSSSSNVFETLTLKMSLTGDTISTNYFKVHDVNDDIIAENGTYQIIPNNSQFFDKKAEALILLKPFEQTPSYEFNYKVEQFDVASLFETFMEDTVLLGKMDIDIGLKLSGKGWDEVEKNLTGKIYAYGKDLTLLGLDLDKVIDRLKRSQRFTFADVGAIFLMGPAGILVTKGSDYASIIILNPGESSHVAELSSKWEITNGLVDLTDVAFSTNENRMAAIGGIDIASDTLNVQFALINDQGCQVFGQRISGLLEDPEMGKVRVVKSLFSPVTNLIKTVSDEECEVFYSGTVTPPNSERN